ncbi:hypothetical protein [Bacillus cereus]|uniref:hypothetical protein n=1 Tax=Bacillus cereus TaxID=1396 RepID=UPI001145BDBA|nr:hypothetical protein [Bacillus cereus]
MTRCTYCKTKWTIKDVWAILVTFEKDCPYCFMRQYLSKKTVNAMPELISLLLIIIPSYITSIIAYTFPFEDSVAQQEERPLNKVYQL